MPPLRSVCYIVLLFQLCTLTCWSTTSAQTFVDISQIANIDVHATDTTNRIAVVDFNQDGLDDMVCCDPDSTVFVCQ